MKKLFTLMALALIVSAVNAQEIRMQKQKSAQFEQRNFTKELVINTVLENGIQDNTRPFRAPDATAYSAGFEGTTGTALPTGWTRTGTSFITLSNADYWTNPVGHCGDPFAPKSGSRMAGREWYNAGNYWLFSSGFSLTAGQAYAISFWFSAPGWAEYNEYDNFEVRIGTTASASAMGSATLVFSNINNRTAPYPYNWVEAVGIFTPTTSGTYYLGFHDLTPAQQGLWILIDDVLVQDAPDNDAAITAITAPVSGMNLTATETVTATIKNNGGTAITSVGMELTVDGTVVATETYTGNIASGATYNYTFTAKANLSAAGNHTIKVRAILTGDLNSANDSFTVTVKNTICNPITVFPFTENFNAGKPDCWQVLGGDDTFGYSWDFGPLSGNGVAASFSYITDGETYGYEVIPDNWLITPQLVLGSGAYSLSFKVWTLDPDYPAEKYSVLVSTTGTSFSDFTAIKTETFTSATTKNVTLPLTDYAGQSIYIAFRHWDCDGQYVLILDDVSVTGATDIPVINGNEINIFQNNGINVLVSEKSDIRIFDMLGKVLGNYKVDANSTLKVYQPAGIYLIEVRSNGGVSTHKVVVK